MTFLERLQAFLNGTPPEARAALAESGSAADTGPTEAEDALAYDRDRWRKKIKATMDDLPDAQDDGTSLRSEGLALGLPEPWVEESLREEFALVVREAVADRVVTGAEHLRLDRARRLLGLSDEEAAAVLSRIVAEAATFFGNPIEGA